jgi:hypothetical protein
MTRALLLPAALLLTSAALTAWWLHALRRLERGAQ